jgi:hypothetical protein
MDDTAKNCATYTPYLASGSTIVSPIYLWSHRPIMMYRLFCCSSCDSILVRVGNKGRRRRHLIVRMNLHPRNSESNIICSSNVVVVVVVVGRDGGWVAVPS